MDFAAARDALTGDRELSGRQFCLRYTELVDAWLTHLMVEAIPARAGIALVALGGHGRRELTPGGDIDVMLLHDGSVSDRDASSIWYPIWDCGLKLGHSVRTPKEALALARDDLHTATALLSARPIAGDGSAAEDLGRAARDQWRKRGDRWLDRLAESVAQRHASAGEVAFALEPDLKEDRGGLRDVHAMAWAAATGRAPLDRIEPLSEYEQLLAARVALHRVTRRGGDTLALQDQDAVAAALGLSDADELMAQVAGAGRELAWRSDEFWYDAQRRRRRRRGARHVLAGISLRDGRVGFDAGLGPTETRVLDVGIAAATTGARLSLPTLEALAHTEVSTPWSDAVRHRFVELLRVGHPAIDAIEALDHAGAWSAFVPEWERVRSRPQRNAYHRFTVDRHLLETAANAAALASRVARPDLLVVGALFHDIGKGYPGDHTQVGVEMMPAIAARMGFDADDTADLVAMVEHHLLLPEVATRRDLDDPTTVERVAERVQTTGRLHLLAALCEADSLATGPAAWGRWKAGLVTDLARRVEAVLAGEPVDAVVGAERPAHWDAMVTDAARSGTPQLHTEADRLTVVAPDRPGLFSRVAGTLALCGLDVVDAVVTSEDGLGIEELRVTSRLGLEIDWARVRRDLQRALAGRLALAVRIAERASSYPAAPRAPDSFRPEVRIIDDASAEATVIEVIGPDSVGLLYRLTQAMAELDLDITRAKVVTVGPDVVDSFYVRDAQGRKLTDPGHLAEIRTALMYALEVP